MPTPFIIAIDGHAASGKGTLAHKLAAALGFAHLDTGLLYRAVALSVLQANGNPADPAAAEQAASALTSEQLNDLAANPALRADTVSSAASQVAAILGVRDKLLKFQRDFCAQPPGGKPGAVLDGRDIGTVICPHAPVKLYITAALETRAHRRFQELQQRGDPTTYETVLKDMTDRDHRDTTRTTAPAKPAEDAVILDTTTLTAEQVLVKALEITRQSLAF